MTSWNVTNEPQMFLSVAITTTQTTGIIIAAPQLNGSNKTYGSLSGGILRIRSGSTVEDIYYATATVGADYRVTLATGVVRNVDPNNQTAIVSLGAGYAFGKGAIVELTQDARLFNLKANTDRANTFTGLQTFNAGIAMTGTTATLTLPTLTTTQRNALTPAEGMLIKNSTTNTNQQYTGGAWSDIAAGGTVNAADGTAGKVDIASNAELGAGTATDAGSGAINVIPVSQTVKVSSGAGDANKLAILGAAGTLAIGFLATGTPTGSKFIRDDGTFQTVSISTTATSLRGVANASAVDRVSNTAVETAFTTKYTAPGATFAAAGDRLTVRAFGSYNTVASGTLTTFKLKFGSTVIVTLVIDTSSSKRGLFVLDAEIICRTSGASGALYTIVTTTFVTNASGPTTATAWNWDDSGSGSPPSAALTGINLTASTDFTVTATHAAASTGNVADLDFLSVVKYSAA